MFLRFALLLLLAVTARAGEIHRLWLTHQTDQPQRLMVNWETSEPLDSIVEFGDTPALGQSVRRTKPVKLHHLEIPFVERNATIHYRVRSGPQSSAVHAVQCYPTEELRVAVIANSGFAKVWWGDAVLAEKPHLLISAGDHIPALHSGHPVPSNDTSAFANLVALNPQLFATTPWLPLLGNHDREIRPRGARPPAEPVYDVDATAFREFFALPGDEWKWHFDVAEFGVRFIALDLNHLSDQGTTWQTCHSPKKDGPQFGWYRELMAASRQPYVITFYNERNSAVRGLEGGEWGRMIGQGSLAITGFGYYAERAEVDGMTYYNTSVGGTGTPYPDPKSAFLKSEDHFILLTFRREPRELRVALKNFAGEVLDAKTFAPRAGSAAQ